MDYPVFGVPFGGGILMAVVAVSHVIVSHFAIGGGLLIAVTETLSVRRGDRDLRELARGGSLMLILVSTVFGAISGVGIWVVAGLISPGAISSLIHTYVWGWAIEWTFFAVEIVAALVYYATWGKVTRRVHVMVAWVYFVAAYLSLVVINGIITFMLTPGRWLETHAFWDGFFNPTYWPAVVLRTGICVLMGVSFLLFTARKAEPEARFRLARYLGWWLIAGALVAYGGYRWWEASLPDTVLGLFRGESPLLGGLAATRSLTLWALAVTLVLGGFFLIRLPRAVSGVLAVLVAISAFTFFGGYERLREGSRKPFLIHSRLFSNGLRIEDIGRINEEGLAVSSGWVAAQAAKGPAAYGRAVFRTECASCHTMDGYRAMRKLLPTVAEVLAVASDDPPGSGMRVFRSQCASCHEDYTYEDMKDSVPTPQEIRDDPESVRELTLGMITTTLENLRDMGEFYTEADRSGMIDTREAAYPYMPPLVGSDEDLEALAGMLHSLDREVPDSETPRGKGGE